MVWWSDLSVSPLKRPRIISTVNRTLSHWSGKLYSAPYTMEPIGSLTIRPIQTLTSRVFGTFCLAAIRTPENATVPLCPRRQHNVFHA